MPDGVGIEVRVTLDGTGNLPHELLGVAYCLLKSAAARIWHWAHPGIIDRGHVNGWPALSWLMSASRAATFRATSPVLGPAISERPDGLSLKR
jgi:hypothetical protein